MDVPGLQRNCSRAIDHIEGLNFTRVVSGEENAPVRSYLSTVCLAVEPADGLDELSLAN